MKVISLNLNIFMLVATFCGTLTHAQEVSDKNIIVKYKQYESFDLGNLEVKGQIIAPGDVSVQETNRKKFYRQLLIRKSFDKESISDITNLR
jgi:hypothetical protein